MFNTNSNLWKSAVSAVEWVKDVKNNASPLTLGLAAVGTTVAIILPMYWYIGSFGSYRPNQGQKFELPPKSLYPFKHRWMTLDINYSKNTIKVESIDDPKNTNLPCIHYIDENSDNNDVDSDKKLCFIMFHGNPTWSFLYRKIIKQLSPKYRCISIDCPGFGLSTAPGKYSFRTQEHSDVLYQVISEIDKQRKIGNIITIQQDWGGPIGFDVMLKLKQFNNKNIIGMVLGNTFCWNISKYERFDLYMFSRIIFSGCISRIFNYAFNLILPLFWISGFYSKNKMSKDILYWYNEPFRNRKSRQGIIVWPHEVFGATRLLTRIETIVPKVFGNNVKVLFCWGLKDRALNVPFMHRFQKMFKNCKKVEFKNGGHYWQEDCGGEAAQYILQWTNQQFKTV